MMDDILDESEDRTLSFEYANLWRRFFAAVLDGIICSMLFYFFMYFFFRGADEQQRTLATIIFVWLYSSILESTANKGTFGKMILGIVVVDEKGERISFLNSTGRFLAKILSAAILFYGFIMSARNPMRQTLHDKLAKTFVIYRNN